MCKKCEKKYPNDTVNELKKKRKEKILVSIRGNRAIEIRQLFDVRWRKRGGHLQYQMNVLVIHTYA